MLLLICILGGLLLLLLLLLLTATLLGVDYLYDNKVQRLRIRVRLLGISLSFKINLDKKKRPGKEKKKQKKSKEEKQPLTPKKFIAFSKDLYAGYSETKQEFYSILREIKERFACHEIYFTIQYGTKNPALTGVLNGALWTAASVIVKVLDQVIGVKKKTIQVSPDFQHECMCLHIKGTFRFKLIDAICFVLKIIRLVNIIKSHIASAKENVNES